VHAGIPDFADDKDEDKQEQANCPPEYQAIMATGYDEEALLQEAMAAS
jgi:hypothetical protein